MSLGPLSRAALHTTVLLALRELQLGNRSWTLGTAFSDLVRGSFCLYDPTDNDRLIIEKHFKILTKRYRWHEPVTVIDKRRNLITVSLHQETDARSQPLPL